MNKLLFIPLLLLLHVSLFSQKLADGKYWIILSDKEGCGYSLSRPEEFLSQRALERRTRQKINLTYEDLPVSQVYIDSLQSMGLTIIGTSKWFNAVIVESNDSLILDSLNRISFVSGSDYKIPRKKTMHGITSMAKKVQKNDNSLPLKLDYGYAYPQIAMLNGNALHELGYLGNDIQIAVIDGGFTMADSIAAFDSLWMENRLVGHRDFSRSESDFFHTHSHGTSVLSTMASYKPGLLIGTAPKASYYLLKSEIVESESPLEEALWVLAAEYADSAGADIINSSLGYSVFDDSTLNYTYSDMDGRTALVTRAAEKAFSKGMIVVISAGNQGNKSWKYISAPADGPNVLAIGAIDTSGLVAAFSSRGPSPDQRVKPDVLAVGQRAMVINALGLVVPGNGTSFAAPQIAGMIACLWEASPEKTNQEVIQAVRRSATLYFNPNDSAGYGIPDFLSALLQLKSSIPEIPLDHMRVVPNPNTGIFEIRSGNIQPGNLKISIYNLEGKKVYSGIKSYYSGFTRITELEGRNSGMYLIVAESDGKKYFSSLILLKP